MDQYTRHENKGGPPQICGQQNLEAAARETGNGHTASPIIEIPDSTENRTRAAGLAGWDSTDTVITYVDKNANVHLFGILNLPSFSAIAFKFWQNVAFEYARVFYTYYI